MFRCAASVDLNELSKLFHIAFKFWQLPFIERFLVDKIAYSSLHLVSLTFEEFLLKFLRAQLFWHVTHQAMITLYKYFKLASDLAVIDFLVYF